MFISKIVGSISKRSDRVINKIVSKLPELCISNDKILRGIKWTGEHISSPQNRLILGVSALLSQPYIDLFNRRVDEDTRKTSASRTAAKIIAGTTSGFFVRYYTIKIIEKMTKMPSKTKKCWETFFTPSPELVKLSGKMLSQYKNTIGSILALVVMLFTNFLFDAPVTKFLTNKFISKFVNKGDKNTNKSSQLPIFYPHHSATNLIDIACKKYDVQGGSLC